MDSSIHSVTVASVDQDGNVTSVVGLGGIEMKTIETTPKGGWKDGATLTFYQKSDDKRTDEQRQKDVEELRKKEKPEKNP